MNQAPSVPVSQIRQLQGDNGAGGFRINLGEIAAAQQAPSLDVRSFAMSEAAIGAAVGNAAQGLSDGGMRIAQEIFASTNRRKVDAAASALAAASQDIAMEIDKEQDPGKWVGIFNTHASKWESTLLSDKNLSPAARDAIAAQVSDWKIRGSSGTLRAAFDQSIKLESQGLEGKRITAAASGDWDTAEAITREQESRGLIGADVAARQRVQTAGMKEEKEKEAAFNTQFDAIKQDARGWLAANPQRPESMDAAVYDRLVSEAKTVDREAVAGDWMRFEEAVESGALTVPAEVMEWEKDNPRITPAMRREAAASLFRRTDAVQKEIARANAPENMARLVIEARSLNPETDSDEKFSAIQNRIAELPEGYRQLPRDILTSKWRNREKLDEPPETARSLGLGIIKSMFDRGMMGSFDNGTGKDANGNPVEPGSPDEVHTRDPNQFENAKVKAADLGGKFVRWHNLNPQATPEEIQQKVYELLPEGTRARVLDRLDSLSAPGISGIPGIPGNPDQTAAGTGDNIDLPGGAGAPAGPGIMPPLDAPAPDSGGAVWVSDASGTAEVVPMGADDIARWKEAGGKPSRVWDSMASKFVTIPADKLIPGRHFMPAGFLPQ